MEKIKQPKKTERCKHHTDRTAAFTPSTVQEQLTTTPTLLIFLACLKFVHTSPVHLIQV